MCVDTGELKVLFLCGRLSVYWDWVECIMYALVLGCASVCIETGHWMNICVCTHISDGY